MADKKITSGDVVADDASKGSEISIDQRQVAGLSQGAIVRKRFFRHRAAVIALIVLVVLIVFVFSAVGTVFGGSGKLVVVDGVQVLDGFRVAGWWPLDWYHSYAVVNPGGNPTLSIVPPAIGEHPFGQDTLGKDVFARVMRGAQQSLTVMFLIGIISTVIGIVIGSLSGYYRGWIDSVLMRFTDTIIIIPVIILGAVLGKTVGGNAIALGIVLGLVSWTGLARLVRGEFLSLREREFVDAAKVAGAGPIRIIFRHILPNAVGVIIVNTTLLMSAAILLETALSYLGFGIQAPDISLGQIISEYKEAFRTRPWLFWWPGLFIVVIALCVNFIGDGLRDAFDPRQKRLPGKDTGLTRGKAMFANKGATTTIQGGSLGGH
jgi:ABC-type dipeptide/oligopeptide/nickel transport system permease subunit